jgi:MFS family permease
MTVQTSSDAADAVLAETGLGAAEPTVSPWAPLRNRVFLALWLASLASNIGSWMHLVAAVWLMSSLTASAALVALLQTANAGPNFLLALPAGALADVLDRRRLVLASQTWQLLAAGSLGLLTLGDVTTPAVLLVMTAALAAGSAMGLSAFGAITAEVVPREQLAAAISLNAVVLTGSQAVGPALGGFLVASLGPGAVFALNAISFLAVVATVGAWRRPRRGGDLPPEHVAAAVRTGLRFVGNAPAFRVVLLRSAACVVSFSALPALLAIFTRTRLDGSASDYGLLLGALGIGGVVGGIALPRARKRYAVDRIVVVATLSYGALLIGFATLHGVAPGVALLVFAGLAGIANMSSLNIAAQSVLPDWVRGRGLAIVQLTFMLAFAGGAAFCGALATSQGVPATLALAGVCVAATAILTLRFPLEVAEGVDVRVVEQPEPFVPVTLALDDGPVLLSVEYRIEETTRLESSALLHRLGQMRRREGAVQWGLYCDPNDPARLVETFRVTSWSEHLRGATRRIRTDADIVDSVRALHTGESEPTLTALFGLAGSHHARGASPAATRGRQISRR